MKTYTVMLGKTDKTFKIRAHCLQEVALVIAADKPDHYWGSTIFVENEAEFLCLPAGPDFEREDPVKSAFLGMVNDIKFRAGLKTIAYDRDGEYQHTVSLDEAEKMGIIKYE